jgi:hypothetical protein
MLQVPLRAVQARLRPALWLCLGLVALEWVNLAAAFYRPALHMQVCARRALVHMSRLRTSRCVASACLGRPRPIRAD